MRGKRAVLAAAAGYALVRVFLFWPGRGGVAGERYGDASEYLRISHVPLLTARFFTDHKPFVYPLFLKLAGGEAFDGRLAAARHLDRVLGRVRS